MLAKEFIKPAITRELLRRLFSKIKVSTEHFYNGVPCWEWTGYRKEEYGAFTFQSTRYRVHRFMYQLFVDVVPIHLHCDHLCRIRHCVNPAHIEPVTSQENNKRGRGAPAKNARKTECQYGHPLSPKPNGQVGRWCVTCTRKSQLEWCHRNKHRRTKHGYRPLLIPEDDVRVRGRQG